MTISIVRESTIEETPRVVQLRGLFDVEKSGTIREEWEVDLPVSADDEDWNIGLIYGPSGCGKTTIAHELFGEAMVSEFDWPADRALIDGFPESMATNEITALLSSVGFSSPPSWLKPYGVLSNGEQFRSTVARALAESPSLAVIDEFTSVVDRQVAQIGSAAVAKAVRRRGQKFVAVSCHHDIVDWLDPDWTYEPLTGQFNRRRERRRPEIRLTIRRTRASCWPLFRPYHYLNHNLHRGATCFVAEVNGEPAAFSSWIHAPHPTGGYWREHRTVCRPDFQGVGIGNALAEFTASLILVTGKKVTSTTSSPAMIHHRDRSPLWRRTRRHGFVAVPGKSNNDFRETTGLTHSETRMTSSFEYVGESRPREAGWFGLLKDQPAAKPRSRIKKPRKR